MGKKLYQVAIVNGPRNANYRQFCENIQNLNAKTDDYTGIYTRCVVSHHVDAVSVRVLCTDKFKACDEGEVTVEEITRESLKSKHKMWIELVERYFLPHDKYPNIK